MASQPSWNPPTSGAEIPVLTVYNSLTKTKVLVHVHDMAIQSQSDSFDRMSLFPVKVTALSGTTVALPSMMRHTWATRGELDAGLITII